MSERWHGRLILVGAVSCYLSIVLGTRFLLGTPAWDVFAVDGASPSFLDARSVTTAWECSGRGIEVLARNPCDPFDRPANYPRIWLLGRWSGLGEEATVYLGVLTALLFFVAVLYRLRSASQREAVVHALVLLSPSVMLGVERGNADLLVFVLVAAALGVFRARHTALHAASYALLMLAAVLKLFPVFAFVVLLRQPRRRALLGFAAMLVAFGAYAWLTRDDLRTINAVVPKVIDSSYGVGVAADAARATLARNGYVFGDTAAHGVGVALAALLAGALVLGKRRLQSQGPQSPELLDGFWAGATIFVGTWLIGHNFDYRLVFLLLVVPQLLAWSGSRPAAVPFPRVALGSIIATLWLGSPLLQVGPWDYVVGVFPPEELLNSFLASYFTAALVLTRPAWLFRGDIAHDRGSRAA